MPDPNRADALRFGPGVYASSSSSLVNGVWLPSLAAIAVHKIPCFRAVALLPSKSFITTLSVEWLRDRFDRAALPRGQSHKTGRQLIHKLISCLDVLGRLQAQLPRFK